MNPKISIVIPVYNHAGLLEETLKCLQNQTFRDYEAILVDDCSTDNSISVAEAFLHGDSRFRIISNKENLGVSQTRNRGLDEAKGEYILFLDDDDYYQENMLAELLSVIEKYRVDIAICKYDEYFYDTNETRDADTYWDHIPDKELIEMADMPRYWLFAFRAPPWCKIYRRDFLLAHEIRFINAAREDTIFSISTLLKVQAVGFVNKKLMTHRKGHLQQTNPEKGGFWYSEKNWWPYLKEIREEIIGTNNQNLIRDIDNRILDLMMHTFNSAVRNRRNEEWTEYCEWVKEVLIYCGWDKHSIEYVYSPPNKNNYRDAIAILDGSYIYDLVNRNRDKWQLIKEQNAHIQTLENEISGIVNSKTFRLSEKLAFPYRAFVKRIRNKG